MTPPYTPGRVSIITACFNDGRWLPETVDSVRQQTHPDVEHIIVDDGSTDPATVELLDRLSGEGMRVVRLTHGGLPRARNAGLAVATGEFLLPLDSDDLIDPTYCAKAVAALTATPEAAIAVPDTQEFGERRQIVRPLRLAMGAALRDPCMYAAMIVRRSAVDEAGGYNEDVRYAEDDELWIRILARHPVRVFLGEALYHYRIRPGQMTSAKQQRQIPALAQMLRLNATIYADHAPGFLGRIRTERAALDHFESRYGPLDSLLARVRR